MQTPQRDRINEILADEERVKAAVVSAVREAVRKHKQAGNAIVGVKDGELVWVPAEEIEV